MQYEQRIKYRPGHASRRWHKQQLSRAHRRLARVGLCHPGVPLRSMERGVAYASSDLSYASDGMTRGQSHNTKPRYKDIHDEGIRGMAVKLAFECRLVARFGGELPWKGVEWVQWLS
jgi:hypothetical protein